MSWKQRSEELARRTAGRIQHAGRAVYGAVQSVDGPSPESRAQAWGRLKTWLGVIYDTVKSTDLPSPERRARAWAVLKKPLVAIVVLVAFIVSEWFLWNWVGPIDTIVFTVLFLGGMAFFPFWIAILGYELPFNAMLGRLHVLLGAIAFNHHYLVDRGDTWEWCPGDSDRVYIDEQWYDIDGGFENRSVLAWRPFGILQAKDAETFREIRTDTAAERDRRGGVAADGGAADIVRGGYEEATPPTETGIDGRWLVDLKRLYSHSIRKFGDVELVETAEAVIERGEVTPSTFEGWRGGLLALTGLVLGIVVGWMTFLA